MNKKTKNALILVLLTVFCLLIFASCNQETPNIFNYSEEDLGVMGKLVKAMHQWIGNYGWTIVVFTVFLRVAMLPLDFWQRYAQRKSALKMQQMQPVIEEIDKRYGANTQRSNEEKQKLYKKQGFSMLSSCLPMIVSMVIFFVMFAGVRNYSSYSNITNFQKLYTEYFNVYSEKILSDEELRDEYQAAYNKTQAEKSKTSTDEKFIKINSQFEGIKAARIKNSTKCNEYEQFALEAVKVKYEENRESWLWINNVLQPDTWATVMQPWGGSSFGAQFAGGSFSAAVDMTDFPEAETLYNKLRDAVLEQGGYGSNGTWNGLMILPFMSVGLSFLSTFIIQRLERKNRKGEVVEQNAQQKTTSKMMMIIMPLMMAWFGFIYTGAFAIYMVFSSTIQIITTIVMRYPVEKVVMKRLNKDEKKNKSNKATYMR